MYCYLGLALLVIGCLNVVSGTSKHRTVDNRATICASRQDYLQAELDKLLLRLSVLEKGSGEHQTGKSRIARSADTDKFSATFTKCKDGAPGAPGKDGADGRPGKDGTDGSPGTNGIDGRDGLQGERGPYANGGAVYTRWGKTSCSNSSSLIYQGFAAGPRVTNKGGGVNFQCLPSANPQYNSYGSTGTVSSISGAEYRTYQGIFPSDINYKNVPCARCYTVSRPAVMMLPALRTCPDGWNREYEGYLMSDHQNYVSTTIECVNADPEVIGGSASNSYGALFYFIKPVCSGSGTTHHCGGTGGYVAGRELTCVVCSK